MIIIIIIIIIIDIIIHNNTWCNVYKIILITIK